jgi:hypothetical protein
MRCMTDPGGGQVLAVFVDLQNHRPNSTAASIPATCATMNAITPAGAIPA